MKPIKELLEQYYLVELHDFNLSISVDPSKVLIYDKKTNEVKSLYDCTPLEQDLLSYVLVNEYRMEVSNK